MPEAGETEEVGKTPLCEISDFKTISFLYEHSVWHFTVLLAETSLARNAGNRNRAEKGLISLT